jgi:hypothetical protein
MSTFIIPIAGKIISVDTHEPPIHLDEFAAAFLAECYGDKSFVKRYASRGTLVIGKGGGTLDEHALNAKKELGDRFCATDLMALALGVFIKPELQWLLDYVRKHDVGSRNNGGHLFKGQVGDLYHCAKIASEYGAPDNQQKAYEALGIILLGYVRQQAEFINESERHFAQTANWQELGSMDGKQRMLCIIESDSKEAVKVAFFKGADVIVHKNSPGHVQIFFSQKLPGFKIMTRDALRMLRIQEPGETQTNWKELEVDGELPDSLWLGAIEHGQVFNGTKTHPEVPTTKLALDKIISIVKIAASQGFEPTRTAKCQKGSCDSKPGQGACRWYRYGLVRCRTIRFAARSAVPAKPGRQ